MSCTTPDTSSSVVEPRLAAIIVIITGLRLQILF
jgi:hypothetical protein